MNEYYLRQALSFAELRRGFCAPNPAVGAVVVKANQILAMGYHLGSGHPHAEVEALNKIGEEAKGATLYITLEPCCHTNKKTPPCTDLILQHGIAKVVYAFRDPNPSVSGKGEQLLKDAGIECLHQPLPEIDEFYQSYQFWWHYQRPFVTAKIAMSLDGKIAGSNGARINITSTEAQQFTHQKRKAADAILTTAKTIQKDNPLMNVRLNNQEYKKTIYILDSNLSVSLSAKIFSSAEKAIIFHQKNVDKEKIALFEKNGVSCIEIASNTQGLDLSEVVNIIGQAGMHDLWVEAGGSCFAAFAKAKLLQKAFIYVAPKWLGENAQAAFGGNNDVFAGVKSNKWFALGKDAVCEMVW